MICPACRNETDPSLGRCQSCSLSLPQAFAASQPSSDDSATRLFSPAQDRAPGSSPSSPESFGRYRMIRLLGAGGMGEVYEAFDQELRERVALKLIRPEYATSPEADARFRRELSVARQVTHRNVVRIHDLGIVDGRKYISMSFVDGVDLARKMEEGRLHEDEAISIAEQLCAGLSAAHQAGIIHRDLKPGNVMVDPSGRVYLMDFGLARAEDETQFTQVGTVVGTVDYMSPEQATGQPIDQRSDIYALGLILFEMFTGRRPFTGDSSMSRLVARLNHPVVNPRAVNPEVKPYLGDIILKCLERDRDARYQSVDEVLADLVARRRDTRRWRRAWRGVATREAALAAAVVLLAVVGAAVFLGRDGPAEASAVLTPVKAPSVSLAVVPFRNASGDARLDWLGTSLGEMLSADVGQSSAVRTVSSARLEQVLRDLAVPADGTIDEATLRRLAELGSADMLVWGQYTKVGERVRIDATLQDFKESRAVRLKTEVTTEAAVLDAVDRLARSIRGAVTTSPDVRDELSASAFKPSSSSVPAVRAYSEGVKLARRGNHQGAARRLAESVQADSSFAMAYSQLALSYSSLGQDDQAADASRRAVELSERLPKGERYLIEANHARVLSDNQKAIEAYERLARVSPEDSDVQFALAGLYEGVGSLDRAKSGYANVLVRDPKHVDGLLALGRVLIKQRNPQASLEHLNRALTLAIELGDIEEKGRVLHTIGMAYKRLNKPGDALRYYQEALGLRRGIGQKNGVAQTLAEVAEVHRRLGQPAEALAGYKEALQLQREIGDRRGAGMTALNMGGFVMERGEEDEALKLFRESLQIHRDLGNESMQSQCLNNIGAAYFSRGQYEDAITYFQQALQLRERLKVPSDIAETLHNLGETALRTGQYDEAISRYLRALDLYRGASDKLNAGIESDAIGAVFHLQGRYGAALKVKTEALKHVRESGENGYWMATVLGGYGHTLALASRVQEADQALAEALAIARRLGNQALVAQVLSYQGDRLFYAGDFRAAGALYRQSVQAASRVADVRFRLVAQLGEARAAVVGGRHAGAVARLRAVAAQAGEMGLRDLVAEASLYLGQAQLAMKDLSGARRQLEDALSRSERLGMNALRARSHYLLALTLTGAGEDAEAARHLAAARRILAEMTREAGTDSVAKRSDLQPIGAE